MRPSGTGIPLRLLILEDTQSDTELLLRALRQGGFEPDARVAANKQEFLQALEEDSPELILADFSLNGFDALQALQILRDRGEDVPFVVVTGTVSEEVVVECIRMGATDYLLKDRLARLGEAVKRALRTHALREENRQAELELLAAREQAQRDYDMLLGRLSQLAEQVALASDTRDVYRALFDFCVQSTPADTIIVASFDPESGMRTCKYANGIVDGKYEEEDVSELPPLPLNDSPQGRAITTGEGAIFRDYGELEAQGIPTLLLGSDIAENPPGSAVAVPLKVQGRTIGAFELQSVRRAAFSEDHLVALSMAANHAAIALENVGLLESEREQRQAAEKSEQRYRELVEHASDGIMVFNTSGEILQANAAAERMLAADAGALQETRVRDWWAAEEKSAPLGLQRMNPGDTVLVERLLRRTDGSTLPVEINVRKLANGNFQSILRDISERKRAEAELLNEKLFSDTVINSLPGLFYLFDEDFRFRRWNSNTAKVTGFSDAEISTMSPLEFFPEEQHAYLLESIEKVLKEGMASASATLRTKSGREIPYLFSSVSLLMEGRRLILGTGLDVSQQQEAEEQLRDLNLELEKGMARLSALHDIDMAITGSVDLELTLNVVVDKVMRELDVDASSIWVYEKSRRSLIRTVTKGLSRSEPRRSEAQLGDGTVGRCGLEREAIRLTGEQLAAANAEGAGGQFADYVAVPLVSKGQLQGVLEVFGRNPLGPSDDWLDFLKALGLQAAIAIDNGVLFQELERSALEITLAYDATIEGWARALDLRDHETEGHSRRVTELTLALARQMGINEAEMPHLRRGALLHDIGKLGVPDAILSKPGPLTPDERAVIERHPGLGYELLSPINFLRPAIDIPYCHHEAWDGSGYPRGLKGAQIPLAARLFSPADVFDALTSDRPYRQAWSPGQALEYVAERSGKQFDPEVTAAFLKIHGSN